MNRTVKIKTKPLHLWQKRVFEVYDEHPLNSIIVIKSPRQRGKTYCLSLLALRQAINNKNQNIYIIVPTYRIARKQFKDLSKMLGKLPCIQSKNETHFEIVFSSGSVISYLSAESGDNLRGNTAHLLIIDESAFCPLNVGLEVFNYTNTTGGNIVIVSTPTFQDENNLFYKYYKLGLEGKDNVHLIDFCKYDTSSMLSNEKLEMYRETMPYRIFQNEIMGEFLQNNSTVFGDFEKVLLKPNFIGEGEIVCGIDFATGVNNDETVIQIFDSRKRNIGLFHFNDKDSNETINYIINIFKENRIRKCCLEINSLGKVMYDFLKQEVSKQNIPIQLIPFTTTNQSKREIIDTLILNIQNQTITLVDDMYLKLQFSSFELKQTPSGLITYGNSSDRIHDDIVIATALALHCFKTTGYAVR